MAEALNISEELKLPHSQIKTLLTEHEGKVEDEIRETIGQIRQLVNAEKMARAELERELAQEQEQQAKLQSQQQSNAAATAKDLAKRTPKQQKIHELQTALTDVRRELRDAFEEVASLRDKLQSLKESKPFHELKELNAETSNITQRALGDALDNISDVPGITAEAAEQIAAQKETITQEFATFQDSAATAHMAVSQYQKSLQKAEEAKMDIAVKPNSIDLSNPKDLTRASLASVAMKEMQMRDKVAKLIQQATGCSYPQANMRAGKLIARALVSKTHGKSSLDELLEKTESDLNLKSMAEHAEDYSKYEEVRQVATALSHACDDVRSAEAKISRVEGQIQALQEPVSGVAPGR